MRLTDITVVLVAGCVAGLVRKAVSDQNSTLICCKYVVTVTVTLTDQTGDESEALLQCVMCVIVRLQDPEFQPDLVASKSYAAAGLCSWVLNIVKFYEVYCEVEPKRQALSKANAELAAAQEKLATIKSKINVRSRCFGLRIQEMKSLFAVCQGSVSKEDSFTI